MKKVTYKDSGVDIDAANRFVGGIQADVAKTMVSSVLKRKGSFGALFALDKKYKNPILVSSTDGVGTKLLLAQKFGIHNSVGIDLVAMNVNDVLCCGAKPLFFLDYIACGKVHVNVLKDVVKGITDGCKISGCSLVGGETAEMPGMYSPNEYDLAGFVVGVVEKDKLIDGSKIREGDCVIGLPSSGLHSNGFSLARKIFSDAEQKKLLNFLLTPTRIYVNEVLELISKFPVKGIAHITGGAFYEKLTKILPEKLCFSIDRNSWPKPKIFQIIEKKGRIELSELYRTFNMGIGMAIVVSPKDVLRVQKYLYSKKLASYQIGSVIKDSRVKIVFEQ